MKALMLNGSCNPKGCTYTALTEVGKTLTSSGIDYEIVQLGGGPVRDCIGCSSQRTGAVLPGSGILRRRQRLRRKARRCGGFCPSGRHHRQSGRSGQVLRHLQHGDGGLHLLEHGPRPLSRGCDAGR